MKVLLLPNNIGSMTAITVQALNNAGHHARGLVLQGDKKQSSGTLKVYNYSKGKLSAIPVFIRWYINFLKNVLWADVIHWNGSFSIPLLKVVLPVIRLLNKPAVVEFVGSDVRIPEIEYLDNPYFKKMYESGKYEYVESSDYSTATQMLFSKADFGLIILPGLEQHVRKDLFKRTYHGLQRIVTRDFEPLYPAPDNNHPVIVHSPSAPVAKGTETIINAISNLRKKYNFDFKLIKNVPHKEAINMLREADIFIDQLNGGHYGMASMEAMAYGKPTMVYIKDYVLRNNLPGEVPVVNVTHDTLEMNLEVLLNNPALRSELGVKSRKYVEAYHDADKEILNIIDTYKKEINNKKK